MANGIRKTSSGVVLTDAGVAQTIQGTAENSQAQLLARVGHPAGTIQSESSVSASVAQANARRQRRTR